MATKQVINPSYYQTSPPVSSLVKHQEHLFHLYAFQGGSNNNDYPIVNPISGLDNWFGQVNVMDWDVHDAPATTATVVARVQGLAIASRKSSQIWHASYTVAFTDERFKESTLNVQGLLGPATPGDEGEWAVVGGTGEFVHAQGICSYKRIQPLGGVTTIVELRIRAVCLAFPKPDPVLKVGPWGGDGGAAYEIPDAELPQRLESLTIYATDFIETIAFSYTDQAGSRRTVGPWGGAAGRSKQPFGPSETVKEIHGATGTYKGADHAVTSLTIVTNNDRVYGPYGKQTAGNTPFHVAAPSNQSIVGFYGRVGEVLHQIGAYVGSNDY